MLIQLKSLHDDILRLIGELDALTKDEVPRLDAVGNVRLKLTRASRRRTTLLEGSIYPRLLEIASPQDHARIVALRRHGKEALMGSIGHIGRWTLAEIGRRWNDYRQASATMRSAMRARIVEEKAVIYPLMAERTDMAA